MQSSIMETSVELPLILITEIRKQLTLYYKIFNELSVKILIHLSTQLKFAPKHSNIKSLDIYPVTLLK